MILKRILITCVLLFLITQSFAQSAKILVPYRVANKWGYSDTSGKIIIAPAYDSVEQFFTWNFTKKDLAYVFTKGKQGIINTAGQPVITPVYDKLKYVFSEAGAVNAIIAWNNKKQGLINYKGGVIIPVEYDTLQVFDTLYQKAEDVQFLARNVDAWYLLDLLGSKKNITRKQFMGKSGVGIGVTPGMPDTDNNPRIITEKDTIAKYSLDSISSKPFKKSAYYLIYKGNKIGLWNKNDRLILPQFDEVMDYEGEWYSTRHKIFARKEGKIGVVTPEGEIVMPFRYTDYYRWDGFRVYTRQNNKMGIYDIDLKIDIAPKYDTIEPAYFRDYPLWKVTINNKKGYINKRAFEYFRD